MRSLNDIIGGLLGGKPGKPRKRRVMEARRRPLGEAVARGLPGLANLGFRGKLVLGLGGGLLVIGGLLAATGALSDVRERAVAGLARMAHDRGFIVNSVTVSGRSVVKAGDVLAALDIQRGDDILTLDLGAARERLMSLSWVQAATIERRLPDTIHVTLVERRPMALWQTGGKMHLVDQNGIAIVGEGAQLALYAKLPLIVGDDAPKYAAELIDLLAREPAIGTRVQAAVRVSKRRWNLKLDNGVEIRLPEEGVAAAFDRLAALERTERLLSRDITVVDMRQPDRLVVRLSDGAVQQMAVPPAKNT
ncbi:cell division protein FtsQ/DivIB [Zavarzinia compransoris]|uniref:Cell division protein FtsQ n=1 Tax=Zavarzinia compransoris TaxID=1264899 RepID=A0A317DUH7_9PROT|nr:cell division protein FtsQ/DivIB [Zavarzinia compransoris]PWR18052.1 cell division protein FtsQ [Zavarzinia compransoris]TDP43478.1 cell division protein FtsQ [Zavarzinia compransoris]